jgi:hypothetical protein
MDLEIQKVSYHRNGISGAPFHVVLFHDPDAGPMVGIIFDSPYHVAVLNTDKLSRGDVTFGSNSWRGDQYEKSLRQAINQGGNQ